MKQVWDHCLDSEASKKNASDLGKVAFDSMAKNKDAISSEELKKMLSPERVESIMKCADKNGDGKIDFQEFMTMLRQG